MTARSAGEVFLATWSALQDEKTAAPVSPAFAMPQDDGEKGASASEDDTGTHQGRTPNPENTGVGAPETVSPVADMSPEMTVTEKAPAEVDHGGPPAFVGGLSPQPHMPPRSAPVPAGLHGLVSRPTNRVGPSDQAIHQQLLQTRPAPHDQTAGQDRAGLQIKIPDGSRNTPIAENPQRSSNEGTGERREVSPLPPPASSNSAAEGIVEAKGGVAGPHQVPHTPLATAAGPQPEKVSAAPQSGQAARPDLPPQTERSHSAPALTQATDLQKPSHELPQTVTDKLPQTVASESRSQTASLIKVEDTFHQSPKAPAADALLTAPASQTEKGTTLLSSSGPVSMTASRQPVEASSSPTTAFRPEQLRTDTDDGAPPEDTKQIQTGDIRPLPTAHRIAPPVLASFGQTDQGVGLSASVLATALFAQSQEAALSDLDLDPLGESLGVSTATSGQSISAPVAPASLPRTAPAMMAQQIAAAVAQSSSASTQIVLNPEELGSVRISLTTGDAGLVVSIVAERPETADLMRRNIDSLLQEFASMGYDNPSFSFDGQGDSGPDSDQPMPPEYVPLAEPDIPSTLPPKHLGRRINGGLDLKL